jgi:alkanesulfonate monooxygenase SsuD/methylene tetrahydromethanopterin reductase-like flavin-dependent oxidoreductase (luciferase family)
LPLQDGGIPLWIAGGGEKKTLRTAAKYASYTNFDGSAEGFQHKSAILEEHCREVGTDFGAITRSANYNVIIGETAADVAAKLEWIRAHLAKYVPADVVDGQIQMLSSGPLVGTPEQICERLSEMNGLGMTYAIMNIPDVAYDRSGLELFTKKVIPALA